MGGKPGFQALRPLRWEAGGRGKSTASIDQNPRERIKWGCAGASYRDGPACDEEQVPAPVDRSLRK